MSTFAKPYFYNTSDNISEAEEEMIIAKAIDKCEEYLKLLENYDEWKQLVKNYNKFITIKHRKQDYSRFAWHKEVKRANDKLAKITLGEDINEIISTAYNDSFVKEGITYYPVDYPQIFKLQPDKYSINEIFENYESAIKYFENLSENTIFKVQSDDKLDWKELCNNLSKFYEDYPHGLIWLTNHN